MILLNSLKDCYESKIKEELNADRPHDRPIQDPDPVRLVLLEDLGQELVPDLEHARGVDPAPVPRRGGGDLEAEVEEHLQLAGRVQDPSDHAASKADLPAETGENILRGTGLTIGHRSGHSLLSGIIPKDIKKNSSIISTEPETVEVGGMGLSLRSFTLRNMPGIYHSFVLLVP